MSHSTVTAVGQSPPWSITEQNDFIECIAHFGTDWAAIACHMGIRTAQEIENHYNVLIGLVNGLDLLPQVEKESLQSAASYFGTDFASIAHYMGMTSARIQGLFLRHLDLTRLALNAEEKRRRGEDMGQRPPSRRLASSLPIIDISPFLSKGSSPEERRICTLEINEACTDFGFFYLKGHGIPVSKLDEIIALARAFFATPLSEKNKIKRYDAGGPEGRDGARGYQGMGENITKGRRDMQEAVDLYREWDHKEKEVGIGGEGTYKILQGPNLWPLEPVQLKDMYLDYISQLQRVGKALVHAMGVALDLGPPSPGPVGRLKEDEEIFVRNTDHSFWVMRMIGYPPLSTPLEEGLSCGEHTDYGCVTLLLSDPTPGALQVLLKDNKTWINADPIAGAFVVNIGDMIERWTNGLWKSTRHRVIHRGKGYRVSVPFFYEPNFEAVVKPLAKCVERTGGKMVHEGNTYGEHLLSKVFNNFYN